MIGSGAACMRVENAPHQCLMQVGLGLEQSRDGRRAVVQAPGMHISSSGPTSHTRMTPVGNQGGSVQELHAQTGQRQQRVASFPETAHLAAAISGAVPEAGGVDRLCALAVQGHVAGPSGSLARLP